MYDSTCISCSTSAWPRVSRCFVWPISVFSLCELWTLSSRARRCCSTCCSASRSDCSSAARSASSAAQRSRLSWNLPRHSSAVRVASTSSSCSRSISDEFGCCVCLFFFSQRIVYLQVVSFFGDRVQVFGQALDGFLTLDVHLLALFQHCDLLLMMQ